MLGEFGDGGLDVEVNDSSGEEVGGRGNAEHGGIDDAVEVELRPAPPTLTVVGEDAGVEEIDAGLKVAGELEIDAEGFVGGDGIDAMVEGV